MSEKFKEFVDVVATLRGENGCPWDKKQTLYSLKNDFTEEAYELLNALDNQDIPNICEELGDVLLHVVLHAQIASEQKLFNIEDVIEGISKKIIRRHPHVFGNEDIKETDEVIKKWEEIKEQERKDIGKTLAHTLDKVNIGMPSINKADKLQSVAAKVGFDWDSPEKVMLKVDEELEELKKASEQKDSKQIKEELGDLLFALVNLARHHGFNADEALREANNKFTKRFNFIEDELRKKNKKLEDSSLEEMEELWVKSKKR